jgi:hypothetical protein
LLAEAQSGKHTSHYSLAVVQAALGNDDAAFAELGSALTERSWCMFLIQVEPAFDRLRKDPRFDRLVKQVGLRS